MFVLTLILLAASISQPIYQNMMLRAREAALRAGSGAGGRRALNLASRSRGGPPRFDMYVMRADGSEGDEIQIVGLPYNSATIDPLTGRISSVPIPQCIDAKIEAAPGEFAEESSSVPSEMPNRL